MLKVCRRLFDKHQRIKEIKVKMRFMQFQPDDCWVPAATPNRPQPPKTVLVLESAQVQAPDLVLMVW